MPIRTVVIALSLLSFWWVSFPASSPARERSSQIVRSYPEPGTSEIPTVASIGITAIGAFEASITTGNPFHVIGSKSGEHTGSIQLSLDRTTAIFRPATAFALNEIVNVTFTATLTGEQVVRDSFSFVTMVRTVQPITMAELAAYPFEGALRSNGADRSSHDADRPLDFPTLNTAVDNDPTPGKIFLVPQGFPPSYFLILDEHSKPLVGIQKDGSDFELQPNGEMTYAGGNAAYYGLDSAMNVIDTFACIDGVSADGHELRVHPDGSYTLLGISTTSKDMSSIAGGNSQATITGSVIQTFDRDHNMIFEWRGIDHYSVFGAQHVDLTGPQIDFEHANSIDIDSDGNYLLSNRHLNEITKINGNTGNIIWRFGGVHNQFTFIDDTTHFSYQHFVRWLPNHHILFFDNGNYDPVVESRAVEYAMDETNMTATQVWEFRHDPPTFGPATGNAERLPNGNTLIGWGIDSAYAATEVDPNGNVVYELTLPSPTQPRVPTIFSYRILKYPSAVSAVAQAPKTVGLSLDAMATNTGYDLSFSVAEPERVSLAIFDIMGRCVAHLFEGECSGMQQVRFRIAGLPSTVYYGVLSTPQGQVVRPMTMLR
jgi:hypothetical protein